VIILENPFTEMMRSNGVIYVGDHIEFRDTLMRWIAIYFSGKCYRYNGEILNEKDSEEVAFGLIYLFDYLERTHKKKS
jgi:hypothetical protein